MRIGLVTDRRFREHAPPGAHPERPERIAAIEARLDESGLRERTVAIPAREATREELSRAHSARHLDSLEATVARAASGGWLDHDTYYSPGTWRAALLSAGAAVEAAQAVANRSFDGAAAIVRPPGHHATRHAAMGFCLLNNAAVAAAALAADGLRVAVVDFDVHHGNGTQDIFYEDPRVLYASTHQFPCYPGTGDLGERGSGAGRGATVNVPLPPGAGDDAILAAYDRVILPAVERFGPDLVIASAGFDAHVDDPLASLRVTTLGYARLARRIADAAGGRVVALLEGGYDLAGLSGSFAAMLSVLLGERPAEPDAAPQPLRPEEQRNITLAERGVAELPPPGGR